jgi:phage terminase large subunit GpA-like protein
MSETLLADLRSPDRLQRHALLKHIESLCAGSSSVDILDWATQYMVYPKSDRSPVFDRTFSPHINFPLQAFAGGKYRIVSLVAPTGFGKSTLIETLVAYVIAQAPGDIGIITQSDEDSKEFAENRLRPTLEAVEPVSALIPGKRYAWRKDQITFPHLVAYIGGANITTLQSKSLRYVLLDEAWTYRPGMVGEALKRTHDRSNSVVLVTGQAGLVGDEFDALHQTCDLHEYSWLCTGCFTWHPYGFETVRWSPDAKVNGEWIYARIVETCHMVCPACDKTYQDNEHTRKQLALSAQYLPVPGGNPIPGRLGLHASIEGVPWVPWSTVAIEYLIANKQRKEGNEVPYRQWQQKRQAKPYKVDTEVYEVREIKGGGYKVADYGEGQQVEGEIFRCMTVDVQTDKLWILVTVWRADGSCRVLYYDEEKGPWDRIRELAMSYHVPSLCVFLDARDGNRTREVYAFCAKNKTCALMGDRGKDYTHIIKGKPEKRFYSPITKVSVSKDLAAIRVLWSSESIKDCLHMMRTKIEVPDDFDRTFEEQMSGEVKKPFVSKTTGATTFRWAAVNEHRSNNHAWDCMAMAVTAAMMSRRVNFPFVSSPEAAQPAQ